MAKAYCSPRLTLATLTLIGALAAVQTGCVASSNPSIGNSKDLEEAADANYKLGVGYLRQGKWELAKEKLEKSLDQNPQLTAAHSAIALVYERLGEYEGGQWFCSTGEGGCRCQ